MELNQVSICNKCLTCISSIIKLHGTKERTIPSLSKNVVLWLIGVGGEEVGGGTKKINLGPGLYSLKFAVNKFC